LIYELVITIADETTPGLIAAFLAVISPLQIYHAQDIRMYTLVLVFELCYLLWFAKLDKNGWIESWWSHWQGSALLLAGAAALYSHNLAGFGLVIPNLYCLARRDWKKLWKLLRMQFVIAVLFLPWLAYLPGQLEKIQTAFWTPRPGIMEILQAAVLFISSLPLPGVWLWVGVLLSLQVVVLLVVELIRLYRNKISDRSGITYFGIILLAPPIILFILSYLIRPVFVPRGFFISTAGLYGLAALVISRQWDLVGGKLVFGLLVLSAVFSLPIQISFREFPRSPFEEAAGFLTQTTGSGDVIINDNKLSHFPLVIYAPNLEMRFLTDQPGSANDTLAVTTQIALDQIPEKSIQSAVDSAARVRFVVFEKTIQEYQLAGLQHPQLVWLDSNFSLVETDRFGDLEIRTYVR
jgi:hypothetical protein